MNVGFTGTQAGMTPKQQEAFARILKDIKPRAFHHGDCIGSDAQAHDIVREQFPSVKIHVHPPEDDKKRAFKKGDAVYAVKPYLERNQDIVLACGTLIVTPKEFVEQVRSGTWATYRYARKARRSIILIFPDGDSIHFQH